MANNEQSLKSIEDFVKEVLFTNFNQSINEETARSVAEKIFDTLPEPIATRDIVTAKAVSMASA